MLEHPDVKDQESNEGCNEVDGVEKAVKPLEISTIASSSRTLPGRTSEWLDDAAFIGGTLAAGPVHGLGMGGPGGKAGFLALCGGWTGTSGCRN